MHKQFTQGFDTAKIVLSKTNRISATKYSKICGTADIDIYRFPSSGYVEIRRLEVGKFRIF